jgi:hypothetical protein
MSAVNATKPIPALAALPEGRARTTVAHPTTPPIPPVSPQLGRQRHSGLRLGVPQAVMPARARINRSEGWQIPATADAGQASPGRALWRRRGGRTEGGRVEPAAARVLLPAARGSDTGDRLSV